MPHRKTPLPEWLFLTAASENDLSVVRHELERLAHRSVFADKAYADKRLQAVLEKQGSELLASVKLVKGEGQAIRRFKKAADDLFSTAVSRVRQPSNLFSIG